MKLTVSPDVTDPQEGFRIDKYIAGQCPELARSFIQKLIKDGEVSLGNRSAKASDRVRAGDVISFEVPEPEEAQILPEDIPLDILYEDKDLIIVNKPKGMVVHPAAGHADGTLVNALMHHCEGQLSGINGVLRPGIVHRIDRDTTGSVIVCKNDRAHQAIAEQLAAHSITRRYRAIVAGNLKEDEGTVDAPIARHRTDRKRMAVVSEGKRAVTHYKVLERFGDCTYIECRLETGRTHQIRVHMSSMHHPLLGDEVYGKGSAGWKVHGKPLQGQVLHAMTIGFIHPTTGEYMEFEAPLPAYFEELLQTLRSRGPK